MNINDRIEAVITDFAPTTRINDPVALLWQEFAIARGLASAADKRKRAAESAVSDLVPAAIGTHDCVIHPNVTVQAKVVATQGMLNADLLRVALLKKGLTQTDADEIIAASRPRGAKQTRYTIVLKGE